MSEEYIEKVLMPVADALDKKNKEIERLQNIIKGAKEYIEWHYDLGTNDNVEFCLLRDRLLEILKKENK